MNLPVRLIRTVWPPNDGLMPGDSRFDAMLADVKDHGILEPLTINLDWVLIDQRGGAEERLRAALERLAAEYDLRDERTKHGHWGFAAADIRRVLSGGSVDEEAR